MKTKFVAIIIMLTLVAGSVSAQAKLTYPQLLTALNARLPKGFTKAKLTAKLISDVERQGVDKPLTADREDDLRQAGATDDLIAAIRANSPALATASPGKKYDLPPMSELLKMGPKVGDVRKMTYGIEMVWIPAGDFMMGSADGNDDEKPVHKVTISTGFWMGKFEVTQEQWKSVIGTTLKQQHDKDDRPFPLAGQGAAFPMYFVSWEEAEAFVGRLNLKNDGLAYKLPTEAEWEYAARAGTDTAFAFGESLDSSQANFRGTYPYGGAAKGKFLEQTAQVGTYLPNKFGLYDMHGNVKEWCEDWYAPYLAIPTVDPKGPDFGKERVMRGGSWFDHASDIRSTKRASNEPLGRGSLVGFRVIARAR